MLALLRIAAASGVDIAKALGRLPGSGKKGKKRVKKAFNGLYARCEDAGLFARMPDYVEDYAADAMDIRNTLVSKMKELDAEEFEELYCQVYA